MPVKKDPKRLQISQKQLKKLKKRIAQRKLAPGDWEIMQAMTEAVEVLNLALAERDTSVGRLCKYLFGAPTETAKNVLKDRRPDIEPQKPAKSERPPPRGHGKNAAAAYTGAAKVLIEHTQLNAGEHCPGCARGKLYELALPSVCVRVVGQAPLKATVYERTRLRCNLCGEIFTPELPAEAGDKTYDESAAAMLGLLKYGCGLPLNRIERLQQSVGQPLPASTQWDVLNATAINLSPVLDALIDLAAQGELIHNDDTTMKVLSYIKEQDPEGTRKGVFTSGLVSRVEGHEIALFMTGARHAGENLTELLSRRASGLCPPIQMCDALSRNASKQYQTILSNCLVHARRQFVELIDRFPEECTCVIEQFGNVYHHEAIVKEQVLSPQERLAYHQQHSAPVMAQLKDWCEKQLEQKLVEPNSGLGKAINYMLKRWDKFTLFLRVPGAPLDNNLCERALKYAILHRKNALFYKTQRGAQVGDLFMSLIHTCQLAGVNPLDYLTWLLKNAADLQKSPERYMPWELPQSCKPAT